MPAYARDSKTLQSRAVNSRQSRQVDPPQTPISFGHAGSIASCMPYMAFNSNNNNNNHQGPLSVGTGPAPHIMDTERAYLIDSLQRQSQRIWRLKDNLRYVEERLTGMAVKVSNVEASSRYNMTILDGGTDGNERRKLRKEARLLKGRITEAEKQGNLVLIRLNDLGIKNQGQEPVQDYLDPRPNSMLPPVSPVAHQWQIQQQELGTPILPSIQTILPQPSLLGPSLLSPLSPPFVPGVMFSNSFSWGNKVHSDVTPAAGMIDQFSPTDMSGTGILYWSAAPCAETLRAIDADNRENDASLNSFSHRSISLNKINLGYAPRPHDKRMSLPSLRSIWP